MTNNRDMVFNYVQVSPRQRDAADWIRANRINPTVLDTSYVPSSTRSTDVLVADKYYRNFCETVSSQWYPQGTLVGIATCDYRTSDGLCDQAVTRFSRDFNEDFGQQARRSLTCHEIGHAIGLQHRAGPGCMPRTTPSGDNYSDHDRGHFRRDFG